jgi:signal transduction histidine kinase
VPQFKPGEARPFEVFVTLHDITPLKRIEQALQASREKLRALAARVQAVREEERTAVAREIHDDLAQELTRLKIDITLLGKLLAPAGGRPLPAAVGEKLAQMGVIADSAIQSVQRIATSLRPVVLDSLGLSAAIEWQAEDFQGRTGIGCSAVLPPKDLDLDRDTCTALFRILQESLTNVLRHSGATRVEILLREHADYIQLRVRDNGRGIRTDEAEAPSAVGLLGMRERARLLGGHCDIREISGEGTTVDARVPRAAEGRGEDELL